MSNFSSSAETNTESGYLFNVDIMIRNKSNALALQKLLEILNAQENIVDFRIQSGIELGATIEQSLKQSSASNLNLKPIQKASSVPNHESASNSNCPSEKWLVAAMQAGRLIRIDIRTKNGESKSIPCRILNFDSSTKLVSIYHVDEKQVYSIHTSEIEKYM
ncbi:hypothetical protein M3231_09695 [Neobacillus mesonae]|nr:hypothetical protein [Neobacillus mesonae]